jgi:hypothetical protein
MFSCLRARAALLASVLVVVACSETTTPVSAVPSSARVAMVAGDDTPSQLDVAQAVPAFGGYYIAPDGAPTVLLTDASQRDAAAAALAGFLASYGWTADDLQVREAQYTYLQLHAWYVASRDDALGVTGAVLGDIDEVNNHITFGGLDAGALSNIASVVAAAGVPASAVSLQISAPVVQAATLRDRTRPPFGGLQIQFFPTPASPLVLLCTLGFNAIDGSDTSFVTNSHCSNVQGGTTPTTDYYQATRGGAVADPANFIAREAEDPEYTMFGAAGCPLGRRCRTSDAARAKYSAGSPFVLGRIARPAFENVVAGQDTILIDAANPQFTIVAEQMRGVVGQRLNKVGRTTGWTSGPITATCVDINITASEITQLCQDLVNARVAGGDSGSPVFGLNTDGTAFLAGILWGSSTNLQTGAVQFIMSPLAQVKAEIGEIRTFDPPTDGKKKTKKK